MAAVATLLRGSAAVAGQQRFRQRAAPPVNAGGSHVSYGAHLVCRSQLRPVLFPAPSFGNLSSPAPASGRLLRTPASASSSDSAELVCLLPSRTFALHTADSRFFFVKASRIRSTPSCSRPFSSTSCNFRNEKVNCPLFSTSFPFSESGVQCTACFR
jgi:hypothetical protein